jgi:cleavage and polyadenylation specificity factor subunit 3
VGSGSLEAIGTLAVQPPKTGQTISGLLVSKDYSYTLLHPKDLPDFAGLSTSTVTQQQRIAIGCGFELVKWHLQGMFGTVEDIDVEGVRTLRVLRIDCFPPETLILMQVMKAVDVQNLKDFEVVLQWDSSASNDMIADSVLALILGIEASPASVKCAYSCFSPVVPEN